MTSVPIDIKAITAVLLADGWHRVAPGSFALDVYEFEHAENMVYPTDGQYPTAAVCPTRFEFNEQIDIDGNVATCTGPLTSIIALRTQPT